MNEAVDLQKTIYRYNEVINHAQNKAFFTRDISLQKIEVERLKEYRQNLKSIKQEYINLNDEEGANTLFCLIAGTEAIEKELAMIIKLKENDMAGAWDDLVDAQIITSNVIRNHPNGDSLSSYAKRLKDYEITLFPKMMFGSWGGIVRRSECSICGQEYDNCEHLKGKLYMGELCSRILLEIDLEEVSTVENPANKKCRVMYMNDSNGNTIDLLTLKIIKK